MGTGRVLRRIGAALALTVGIAAVPAAAADANFLPYEAYWVGSWPDAVAIGDVTGDGRNDVVMTTHFYFDDANDYKLWVFAGRADGELAAPVKYATAATYTNGPDSVAIGDITGDGRADVVLGLLRLGVQVFPQLGDGTLGAPSLTLTNDSYKIRLGKLNADAQLDVAAVGWGTDGNTVSVLLNDGAGGLQAPVTYTARHGGYDDLEVADVSGDGRDDLIVMSGQGTNPDVSVLAQLADGGFGPAAEYTVPEGTWSTTNGIGVGDVTGDGRNDVVASYGGNQPNSWIAVFAQQAGGTLAAPVSYPSYDIPESTDVADIDLDGRSDIVTLHGGWNAAGLYRQAPSGALGAEELSTIPYASHYDPHGLALGDVDGNGSPDLAIADYNHGLVILHNTRAARPPSTADLGVAVSAGAKNVNRGKTFTFSATVTNAGPDTVDATLVLSLTGGASGLTASGAACQLAGTTATCSLPGLARGGRVVVRLTGTATTKGTLTATGTVDGSDVDGNAANDLGSASIQIR